MAKRSNGEGSVRKSGNSWIAKIQVGWLPNGRPKIKSFSAPTRKGALERMESYLKSFKECEPDDATISDGIKYWLETFKSIELKDSSYTRLEVTIDNNIIPYIGKYMTKKLTSSVIQTQMINVLVNEGKSYSTIKKAYFALNAYYKKLISTGKAERNPMLGVTLPSQSKFERKKIRALTKDEQDRFIRQAVSKFANGNDRYRYGRAYIFMMFTGLRCSEMLGLTWRNIDLVNNIAVVKQSLVTVKNRETDMNSKYIAKLQDSTKTQAGIREIPLCSQAVEAITAYKEKYYSGNPDDYVITSAANKPLKTRHFERSANYIFNAAGIKASGLHIFRHTFASMLFEKNVDIKLISSLLGHSDVSTTYNIYVHLTGNQKKEAINAIDKINAINDL